MRATFSLKTPELRSCIFEAEDPPDSSVVLYLVTTLITANADQQPSVQDLTDEVHFKMQVGFFYLKLTRSRFLTHQQVFVHAVLFLS